MLGLVIGDVVGSVYERHNIKTKDFPFFQERMRYTDDTYLSCATAEWLLHGGDLAKLYRSYVIADPNRGFGGTFIRWAFNSPEDNLKPYGSFGNGSAMRVGPVAWAFETKEEVLAVAAQTAECTHNHPEGIKGAQAIALATFMARKGATKEEIRTAMTEEFGYDLSLSVDEIRPRYSWSGMDGKGIGVSCMDSVPQAIVCALEASDFEDAIRNAVSIGGDSDTIACMAGSIAEALYGIPSAMYDRAISYLDDKMRAIVEAFECKYGKNVIEKKV